MHFLSKFAFIEATYFSHVEIISKLKQCTDGFNIKEC